MHTDSPTSYGIFKGAYAGEPAVLPDGRLVVSWAADVNQDYGLYLANADGTGLSKLYDNPGTTELRARVVAPRPKPPIIADTVPLTASLLPPPAQGPYNQDGTFVFNALNVYFNGPVDTEIANAPPVGSANTIRFFIDQQRTSPGSFPNLDWPILLGERSINPDGSVREPNAPANVPVFEQIRAADGTVPFFPGILRQRCTCGRYELRAPRTGAALRRLPYGAYDDCRTGHRRRGTVDKSGARRCGQRIFHARCQPEQGSDRPARHDWRNLALLDQRVRPDGEPVGAS